VTPSADVLAAALAAATRRDTDGTAATTVATANAAAVVNGSAELARERSIADINMSVGWVPGVGTVINAMSLASDFLDFTLAALRGDAADIRDEIGDMVIDVIGMIPVVGAPVAATIYRATAPVNRAPRPVDDSYSVDQDTMLTGNVLTNDTDPDGDTLTVAVDTAPSHGSLTLNADGSFTYTPAENFYGPDAFSYTVIDGKGGTAVGTASITVNYVAPPPVVDQQQPYSIDGTDPDTGRISGHFNVTHDKPLTYHVVTAPDPALGTFELDEQTGAWTFTPNPRTRVLAGYFAPDSPAAVKLTFAVTVTDGTASTAPIVVDEHIAGADRAALALPAGTTPILSLVDPTNGDAYVFGSGGLGDIFSPPDDQSFSYLAAIIHSDGSYSIPAGGNRTIGVARDTFVVGDTIYVVTSTADDLGNDQTHLSELGPDGLTTLPGALEGSLRDVIIVGDTANLITKTGVDENGYQIHRTGLGPDGLTPTTSIPGSTYYSPMVIDDTTYLFTETGSYYTGYQTHLTRLGTDGVGPTTSIPGTFHESSTGFSIVVGDITYVVTETGDYETGYETHVTSVSSDGVVPPMSISGSAEHDPIVIGDTTYLLVNPYSRIVTHVLALTSAGAITVGSIPGVLNGDPIVAGDTTYVISQTGADDPATRQVWVTTLTPALGGITLVGDPIPGYRFRQSPLVVGDTTYLVTETWNSTVGSETSLTAISPDGVTPVRVGIPGRMWSDLFVVVLGDTTYLATTTSYYYPGDRTNTYEHTYLTTVGPDGPTPTIGPIPGYPGSVPIVVGDTTYLVMETDDPTTGYQVRLVSATTNGLTPVGDPIFGRVNPHNDLDVIIVGSTTYLAVEKANDQTTLMAVGPDGLNPVFDLLPGHLMNGPIAIGDTTYLVTQTGEYDSAQTYFTAVKPDGVLLSSAPIAGELRDGEPIIVAGDTTYAVTVEWEVLDGGYRTSHTHVITLTPDGFGSVDCPGWAGQTIVVGDITYLVTTVYPEDSGEGADTTKTYLVALTPDGPEQLADPVSGYLSVQINIGDSTFLAYTSYPDDADGLEDFTTYTLTLTADGAFVDDFPGLMTQADASFTVGDTRYMMTTSGVWAIEVDA
jgi:hypothetical protein